MQLKLLALLASAALPSAMGERPVLQPTDPTRVTKPAAACPPKGADPRTRDARLAALRDAGTRDLPLTRSGCERELTSDDGGTRRTERWVFRGHTPLLHEATELRPDLTVEARDTNEDGILDYETITTLVDGGEVQTMAIFSYPYDGGHAGRQWRSTALGGNRRQVEELIWRDGGWLELRSFQSTWRDEPHFRVP